MRVPVVTGLFCIAAAALAGPTAAETARAIREAGLDPDACYRVRDLSYVKEDLKIYLNDGYLTFSRPVAGERIMAVFTTEVEGGDGEILLLTPQRSERQSLAKFTNSPNLSEHFQKALLAFSDGGGNALLDRVLKDGVSRKSPEVGATLVSQWNPVLANIGDSFSSRLIEDLLTPVRPGGGFFFAALVGKQLGNFDVIYDPRGGDQIVAAQFVEKGDRAAYDIWTSFPARNIRVGSAKPWQPDYSLDEFHIDAALDANLNMKARTQALLRVGAPRRVFVFEVSRAMEVGAVRVDGNPAEVLFRESIRRTAIRPGENDIFLVTVPELLPPGSTHQIEFEHQGSVIASLGKGVYYVGARSNWYPRVGDEFATYDLTFRYPRRLTLVSTGDLVDDKIEDDTRITHRKSATRIRLAGFNLGEYERVANEAAGLTIEVYGNRNLEPALQPKPVPAVVVNPNPAPARGPRAQQVTTVMQTPPAPDPLARLKTVADDVAAAVRFFSDTFGSQPLKSLTVSPIPGTFGQGFPGLIYLSTLAYLNPNERPAWVRARQQVFFNDIIQAHEVAHQWWGNVVGAYAYQDEWIIEALSHYSALLWIEKKKGPKAVEDVLLDYRDDLMRPNDDGATAESAGPLTWGFRLDSAKFPDAWRAITYEKGAWVFHMLRQRLGDERFLKMLAELRRRFEFRSLTTRDLQALAKEFRPPGSPADGIDAFFENWVYATGIPSLKLKSSSKGAPPQVRLTGSVEQAGVDQDFTIEVPVEVQFAKGAPQIVWVRTSTGESATFSATLPQVPLRVTLLSGAGVLAAKK